MRKDGILKLFEKYFFFVVLSKVNMTMGRNYLVPVDMMLISLVPK